MQFFNNSHIMMQLLIEISFTKRERIELLKKEKVRIAEIKSRPIEMISD